MPIPIIIVSMLIYSSLIAMMSLGFTLTYTIQKIPNFAHGIYAGFGIYVTFTITKILEYNPYYSIPVSFVFGGLLGMILFRLVIYNLNRLKLGSVVITISTIALGIFLKASIDIYAYWLRITYKEYAQTFLLKFYDFKLGRYQGIFPVSIICGIMSVFLLYLLLKKTNVGIAMRATTEDIELASIVGINVNRIQLLAWFITGSITCIAGSLLPFWFQSEPNTGNALLLTTMAASLVGGLNEIWGAVLGGYLVGFFEILITVFLQRLLGPWVGEYRPLIPMFIVIIVLLFKPDGLTPLFKEFYSKYSERHSKVLFMDVSKNEE